MIPSTLSYFSSIIKYYSKLPICNQINSFKLYVNIILSQDASFERIFSIRQNLIRNYNISQIQFQSSVDKPMLKRFPSIFLNFAKLNYRNIYLRSYNKTANKKDLYNLLGVSKNAQAKQIKKAYYKLAQEYHPDKNSSPQAKEKFTEINNAYEILSDPSKRQNYDQTGNTGEGSAADYANQNQHFTQEDIFHHFKEFHRGGKRKNDDDLQDILKDIFGGASFNPRQGKNKKKEQQISTMNVTISFQQSVRGCTKVLQYEKRCTCQKCKGSKCKPGTQPQKCRGCDGFGVQNIRQGMFVIEMPCGSCSGVGTKIKYLCGSCNGTGVQKKKVRQQIAVPRGINDGASLKFSKKGNFEGDLIVKVQVKKSNVFGREGLNAISQLQITVLEAVLGIEKEISTIQGEKRKIVIPKGHQDGDKIILKDQGFYMTNSHNKGDHIITVKVIIPKSISSQQKSIYQKLKAIAK